MEGASNPAPLFPQSTLVDVDAYFDRVFNIHSLEVSTLPPPETTPDGRERLAFAASQELLFLPVAGADSQQLLCRCAQCRGPRIDRSGLFCLSRSPQPYRGSTCVTVPELFAIYSLPGWYRLGACFITIHPPLGDWRLVSSPSGTYPMLCDPQNTAAEPVLSKVVDLSIFDGIFRTNAVRLSVTSAPRQSSCWGLALWLDAYPAHLSPDGV